MHIRNKKNDQAKQNQEHEEHHLTFGATLKQMVS